MVYDGKTQWSLEEEAAFKKPILERYEHEGHPYFSSARYVRGCGLGWGRTRTGEWGPAQTVLACVRGALRTVPSA